MKTNVGPATIKISRTSEYTNSLRTYRLVLDGKKIGGIKNGETAAFSVEPGKHTLQTRIDWLKSNRLQIDIQPGQTIFLEIGFRFPRHWRTLGTGVLSGVGGGLGIMLFGLAGAIGAGIGAFFACSLLCKPHITEKVMGVALDIGQNGKDQQG